MQAMPAAASVADRIRVLFFYPNKFLGPVMTVFTHIIRHLDRDRVRAYVAVNEAAEGQLSLTPDEAVVTRWKFGGTLGHGSISDRMSATTALGPSMAKLARYVRSENIDVIQCASTPYAGTLGATLATLTRRPLVVHFHDLLGRYSGGLGEHSAARKVMGKFLARSADQLVSVSRFVANQVVEQGLPEEKMAVVINGVNLERFTPNVDGAAMRREYGIPDGAPLVLQLARILQSKRQEDFVKAFAIAQKRVPELRGLIVGWEDPRYRGSFSGYKAELEHLIRENGIADRFAVGNPRPEAPQLMAASDIVVMPSIDDPCPLVVLEAMASGKPVVGARSGGIPEMIADGETGFVVPPESPQDLADKLCVLARDPALRERMGRAGRARVERHFDERRLAAEFTPIYERLRRG